MDVYCVLFDRKLSASHDSSCQPLSGMTNCEIDEVHWNAVSTQDSSITRARRSSKSNSFHKAPSFIVPWRKFLTLPLTIYRLAALLWPHHVARAVKFCTNCEQNEPEMRYRVWDIVYSLIHTLLIILFQHSFSIAGFYRSKCFCSRLIMPRSVKGSPDHYYHVPSKLTKLPSI